MMRGMTVDYTANSFARQIQRRWRVIIRTAVRSGDRLAWRGAKESRWQAQLLRTAPPRRWRKRPRCLWPRQTHCSSAHVQWRSEEHTSELQSLRHLVCRLLLEKKKK